MLGQRRPGHDVVELLEQDFFPGSSELRLGIGNISDDRAQRRKFLSRPQERLGGSVVFLYF